MTPHQRGYEDALGGRMPDDDASALLGWGTDRRVPRGYEGTAARRARAAGVGHLNDAWRNTHAEESYREGFAAGLADQGYERTEHGWRRNGLFCSSPVP